MFMRKTHQSVLNGIDRLAFLCIHLKVHLFTFRILPLLLFAILHLVTVVASQPDSSPKAEVVDVRTISHSPEDYHGWPTLTRLQNGRLMVVYSGNRDYHVCPFGRLELIVSEDDGKNWSSPRVLLDSIIDVRDGGLVETQKGTLLATTFTSLAYQGHLNNPERLLAKAFGDDLPAHLDAWRQAELGSSQEEKEADVGSWLLRSEDGGRTWSERVPAPCNSPHGPILMRDGRLLYAGKELWQEDEKIGVWVSDDDGRTWELLSYLAPREGESNAVLHELHAVEAEDGTLIVQARLSGAGIKEKKTLQTESHDGGSTWTQFHEIGVTGYPTHLARLADGRLLMTYSYRKRPYGIRGKISDDNGKTWSEEFIIYADGPTWDLGYPSTAELSDGTLITVWYEVPEDTKKAALRQARWTLPKAINE